MYIVDVKGKSMKRVNNCTFSSLKLKERHDLQEWIRNEPSSLGEELLIISKEFAGFEGTKERLDLLALDKKGNLVIIENKLDDSGKDVTWQAIKYASYCSSLNKKDIIKIFQDYLLKESISSNASEILSEFYGGKDIDEIEINKGNNQRIFLVAANFRKEVTSSVLWLQNFNIRIKCIKVTPYKFNNQIVVDFDQIIPVVDAEEFQIKIANKEQDESITAESTERGKENRFVFWSEFLEYNNAHGGLFDTNDASKEHWISKSVNSLIKGANIQAYINNQSCRVELVFNLNDKDTNKQLYDKMAAHKTEIEKQLPNIEWKRMDDKISSSISINRPYSFLNKDDKEKIFIFFVETAGKMREVLSNYQIKE